MAELYTNVEFPISINMPPRTLHKGIYEELEEHVRRKLEGKCQPKIGFIKKGSVQIVKKQLGKSEGGHLTGNVTFNLQVRCSAAMPVVGQKLPCMVVTKNEYGVLATNYQLPAYTMLIMKMTDDSSDALERVQRGSYIEVEVKAYQLKPDNPSERIKSEHWLVCSLANDRIVATRYQILPQVASLPMLVTNNQTYNLTTINDKRNELTDGAYSDLEETKKSIQQIREDYINMLKESDTNVQNDIMLAALLGKNRQNFILGVLNTINDDGKGMAVHDITVLWSSMATLARGNNISPEVKVNRETVNPGAVVLYQNYDSADGSAGSYSVLDFWGRHVKYVINETEMVHPNGQYLNQLTRIICSQSETMKSKKVGNRKTFTDRGNPVATIVYRDQHVISRAYYKMREFIAFFGEELFPRRSMKIACIAESPGGFVQALLDQRMYDPTSGKKVETGIRDNIVAMSIGINYPPWKELHSTIEKYNYDYVSLRSKDDGTDANPSEEDKTNVLLIGGHVKDNGEGNILDPDNRERFYLEFAEELEMEKADLITGDGGIERNKKETTEEMDTHRLLLAEIIMALQTQKRGGSFILKIYDMATEFTMNMMQVLSYCYDEVGLFKPATSRAASSEKYVVSKRFNVSEADRIQLITQLESIHQNIGADADDEFSYYGNMIGIEDAKLKQAIKSYNGFFMKKQIAFIESGRNYSTMYNNTIRSGNVEKMSYDIMAKIGNQVSTADEFAANI